MGKLTAWDRFCDWFDGLCRPLLCRVGWHRYKWTLEPGEIIGVNIPARATCQHCGAQYGKD